MSDTAISSQISTDVSSAKAGELNSASAKNTAPKTQVSEFDEVLNEQLDSALNEVNNNISQEEILLSSLLVTDPKLLNSQTSLTTPLSGNVLPTSLPTSDTVFAELLSNSVNPNDAKALTTARQQALIDARLPLSNATAVLGAGDIPIEEDFFTKQLNSSMGDKELLGTKQLNAQLFNQLINQSLNKSNTSVDNSLLPGVSGLVVTQSISAHSNSAMLPAVTVSPDNPQFAAQVGERINWMVNNNMQRADIRLDPPELGNLDIRLNISKDNQASILIHVTNPTAKEAIESAIPRLRDMFEHQGLDLANVDVSQQNQQQQSPFEQFDENDFAQNRDDFLANQNLSDDIEENEISAVSYLNSHSTNNLLDIFA